MAGFVTPALRLTSSWPAVIFPVPSAVKLPATATGPLASNPCSRKAYWPFSFDSLPVPQGLELVTVMVADADLVASATEVAVRVTVAGFGTLAGAVYVTGLAVVLLRVPHVRSEERR